MASSKITVFPLPVGAEATRGLSVYTTYGLARYPYNMYCRHRSRLNMTNDFVRAYIIKNFGLDIIEVRETFEHATISFSCEEEMDKS